MAYVYRFKDVNDKIIYVGYTGQDLSTRMSQHFTKGHLSSECYKSIAKIEYQTYKTKADAQIMETVYINKYKPKYNKLNKQTDNITFDLGEEKAWKTYRVFKVVDKKKTHESKWYYSHYRNIGVVIYLILIIILYFVFN